jgi:MOSC domain-containing protein
MLIEIGHVEAIFRYPVKSMGGERLEVAELGWHGLDGDRRLAFRRIDDRSGLPWLTASKLPDLLLFAPHRLEHGAQGDLPTHVRTPDGEELPIFGEDLAREVGRRFGAPVQMMQLNHGIFDEASISVIASDTVREIGRLAGRSADVRRFRPNVVVRLLRSVPFQEDEWVGGVLSFGEGDDAPAITVTMRDVRCSMVNLDPDSASPAPEMLKAVVRANQNNAGIYGAVTRIGRLVVGQTIILHAARLPLLLIALVTMLACSVPAYSQIENQKLFTRIPAPQRKSFIARLNLYIEYSIKDQQDKLETLYDEDTLCSLCKGKRECVNNCGPSMTVEMPEGYSSVLVTLRPRKVRPYAATRDWNYYIDAEQKERVSWEGHAPRLVKSRVRLFAVYQGGDWFFSLLSIGGLIKL